MKIGFIGGTGWIARHMVIAMVKNQLLKPEQCMVSNRSGDYSVFKLMPGIRTTSDNQRLIDQSDVVFVCVRPQSFRGLALRVDKQLVVSIMAGVSIETISQVLGCDAIIRTMPNAAIEVYQSMTPWFANDAVTDDQKSLLKPWLNSFGRELELEKESQLDYLTALSGSSHGLMAYLQKALLDAAVDCGIGNDEARHLTQQVFTGNSLYMQQEDRDPAHDLNLVIDYDGTTAALCRALIEQQVDRRIQQAIKSSFDKACSDMSQ